MEIRRTCGVLPLFPEESAVDWTYNMRREMQEIIPGLYLGPYSVASRSELESLKGAGITHIVCVRHRLEASQIKPNFPHVFKYLVLDIADDDMQNIIQFFPQVNEFLLTCLQAGGKVLVHGRNGMSRSAALVLGFIMLHCDLKSKEAFDYLQKRRFCTNLNKNFAEQLVAYEPMCEAYQTLAPSSQSQCRESRKRKWEYDTESEMDCQSLS